MNRKLSFIVGVFACAYVALSAQSLPAGVQKGPSMHMDFIETTNGCARGGNGRTWERV